MTVAALLSTTYWDGHMWGWNGVWMALSMLLFWGGLIAVGVWLARGGIRRPDPARRARDVLAQRYARGDLDTNEYQERLDKLDDVRS
ncbi:MAG: SHOCT domain-containing protein [Egibacteraceae bacterium]|jgi:putative membrane protein